MKKIFLTIMLMAFVSSFAVASSNDILAISTEVVNQNNVEDVVICYEFTRYDTYDPFSGTTTTTIVTRCVTMNM